MNNNYYLENNEIKKEGVIEIDCSEHLKDLKYKIKKFKVEYNGKDITKKLDTL